MKISRQLFVAENIGAYTIITDNVLYVVGG